MVHGAEESKWSILKLIFGKNEDGKWAIEALKGLPLKPRGTEDEAFFAIQDDLVLAQPAFFGNIRSVLAQSIVPIVAHVQGEPDLALPRHRLLRKLQRFAHYRCPCHHRSYRKAVWRHKGDRRDNLAWPRSAPGCLGAYLQGPMFVAADVLAVPLSAAGYGGVAKLVAEYLAADLELSIPRKT